MLQQQRFMFFFYYFVFAFQFLFYFSYCVFLCFYVKGSISNGLCWLYTLKQVCAIECNWKFVITGVARLIFLQDELPLWSNFLILWGIRCPCLELAWGYVSLYLKCGILPDEPQGSVTSMKHKNGGKLIKINFPPFLCQLIIPIFGLKVLSIADQYVSSGNPNSNKTRKKD